MSDPYTDPNITATRDEVDDLSPVAVPDAPPPRTTTPKQEDAYNNEDRVDDVSGLPTQVKPPHVPRFPVWDDDLERARDIYANDGATDQDFLKNQG